MAKIKSTKPAVAKKAPRKTSSAAILKSPPASAHADELKTAAISAMPLQVIRAVMAAPPPTGQPHMPPGKAPRVADRPKFPNKVGKKRAVQHAAN